MVYQAKTTHGAEPGLGEPCGYNQSVQVNVKENIYESFLNI